MVPAMNRRRLPTGIQTFRELRERDCYYVDKTEHIERLIDRGKHYFLSRPRRFGKSLLVDTLKELFEGNEALFEGLHIHRRRDWSVRHPVVRLDFATGDFAEPGYLHVNVMAQLDGIERAMGLLKSVVDSPRQSEFDYYYTGVRALFLNDLLSAEVCFKHAHKLGDEFAEKIERHLENLKNRK